MTHEIPRAITLAQFTIVFVLSGLMLTWALLRPEFGGDLELGRTRLTVWPPFLLLIPALVLSLFRSTSQGIANLAYLFWTAALVTFVIHVYWGGFVFYDGLADTFRNQGLWLAGANFALLAIWTLDTVLLWFAPEHRYLAILHGSVRVLVFALVGLDLIVGRSGPAHVLGYVFVGTIVAAWVVRYCRTNLQLTA